MITYIYQNYNQAQLKQLEVDFLDKSDGFSHYFSDWLVYDYTIDKQQTYADKYLEKVENKLDEKEIEYINKCIKSYLGFYEVVKIKDEKIQCKNLFTNELHMIEKTMMEEDVNLHEILLLRLTLGAEAETEIVSSNVVVLPYQFKTLMMGQIHEGFGMAKERKNYLTYPQYFKENLLTVLQIVNRMLSYKDQEGDVTLYQSVYAVKDYAKVKEIFSNLKDQIKDEEAEDGIYQLMEDDLLLAEMVLQKNRLEVECSNTEDQKTTKKVLAEKLEGIIVHLKDEELTIDDLI